MFGSLFLSVQAFGEIPFEQLKGLHTNLREDAKAFSPLYGFVALKGNVLKNIRFYGNYGKESYGFMDGGSGGLAPKPGFDPRLMHPAFFPKIASSNAGGAGAAAGGEAVIDAAEQQRRNAENLFEVPLDPISTLMQWLFPSVDGVNFVANDRSKDPVGYFGLTKIKQAKKQEELEKVERQIEEIKATDDYAAYTALPAGKAKGDHDIGKSLRSLNRQKDSLVKVTPVKSFAEILRVIHDFMNRGPVDQVHFVDAMIEALPNVPTIPGETPKSQIFAEILYSALIEDGTFPGGNWDWMTGTIQTGGAGGGAGVGTSSSSSVDHNPLYPKHIALHALLGYLWRIFDQKSEFVEVLEKAGLIDESEKDLMLAENYTHQDYTAIKKDFLDGNFADFSLPKAEEALTFAGYGYEVYEKSLPSELGYTQANVPFLHSQIPHSYPDCGETSLRNFFNILTYVGGGNFDGGLLTVASPKMDKIREFYGILSTQSKQLSQPARDAWSNIIINLNASPQSDPSSNFDYINDVYYRGRHTRGISPDGFRFSEIASTPHGIINVLNVFARLTEDAILSEPWVPFNITKLYESPDLFAQITKKLDRLCEIFSRAMFVLDWKINGSKNLNFWLHGNFVFSINGKDSFTYQIQQGHFVLSIPQLNISDWRKTRTKSYDHSPLLNIFYGFDQGYLFQRGAINESRIPDIMERLKNDFRNRTFDHPSITVSLRILKKTYESVLNDEHAMKSIFQNLGNMMPDNRTMDTACQTLRQNSPLQDFMNHLWNSQENLVMRIYNQSSNEREKLLIGQIFCRNLFQRR